MVLALDDPSVQAPVGELLRLPVKFIKGQTEAPAIVVQLIAKQLSTRGKNVLPVLVKCLGPDKYQATLNTPVLAAARLAKLDFVWCMVADEPMQHQAQIEAGLALQVNILTASEQGLVAVLEYVKVHKSGFAKLDPAAVARAIVAYRQKATPTDLTFLTKLKCGIGKTKLLALAENLVV
jgi:hypothetical protein